MRFEFDFKFPPAKAADNSEPDVFDNILAMAEDMGIEDWAQNHDHYLYGTPQKSR